MTMLSISEVNKDWGICGFASTLGALYKQGIFKDTIKRAVSRHEFDTRLLAEIKTYLVILQSEDKNILLNEIQKFTRTFGGIYSGFTIQGYINKVNTIAVSPPLRTDKGFSIAMPPNAVVDYLKRICDVKNPTLVQCNSTTNNNVILGIGDKRKVNEWKGLGHWVYKKSNLEIYNWGQKETLTELLAHNPNWQIIYEIRNLR